MRIAYVGNFEPEYSTENDVRKAFEFLGHEVVRLQEGDAHNPRKASFEQVRSQAINSDMLLWTGTWGDAYPLADVLDLMHELGVRGIPSATLHLDTFWSTKRDGRKWWLEPMFFTSHLFTADGDYQEQWQAMGKKHTWLPPAVRHDAAKFGTYRDQYACDVAFVGSNGRGYHEDVWTYRRELVDALRVMCDKNGWSFKNPGGDQDKITRSDDMNDFYASAKVTVGDSLCLKKEVSQYWSDRVPEATGRGGLLIMPRIKALDLPEHWSGHIPQYEWGNFVQLEKMIRELLADDEQRGNIKKNCQSITASKHTYVNRAEIIIKVLFR
jgi:hypothetical protein